MNQFKFILDPAIGKRLRLILMGIVSFATLVLAVLQELEANQWAVSLPFIVWLVQYVANYTSIGNAPVYGPPAPNRDADRKRPLELPESLRPRPDADDA